MQNFTRTFASLSLFSLLDGFGTLINDYTQNLAVTAGTPGESCAVYGGGAVIATVNSMRGTISVPRSQQALAINCANDGYTRTLSYDPAHISVTEAANLPLLPLSILTEPVDVATDSNFHDPDTHVVLATAPGKQASDEPRGAAAIPNSRRLKTRYANSSTAARDR